MAYAQITFAEVQSRAGRTGSSNSDRTAALKFFAQDSSMSGYDSLLLPSGLVFDLTETITVSNRKVGIIGTGTTPKIRSNKSIALHLKKGGRIQKVDFEATINNVTLIQIGGTSSSGNEDDTDGSITGCKFILRTGNTAINYNGRNCNINNNTFEDLGNTNTALRLRWDGIAGDGGESTNTTFRKNRFFENVVDLTSNSRGIVVDGQHPCYGLLISSNRFRYGCQILRSDGQGVDGVCITDNKWGEVTPSWSLGSEGVIQFSSGKASGVIYDNDFYGAAVSNSLRPLRHIRTGSGVTPGLAIARNLMDRSQDGKDTIQLSSSNKSGVVAYQNDIKNGSGSSRGNNGVTDGAVKFSN